MVNLRTHLDERLVVEALLVANDLERLERLGLVVPHLDHLAERALAEHGQDLVPEQHVIVQHNRIVAALVVVPAVARAARAGNEKE